MQQALRSSVALLISVLLNGYPGEAQVMAANWATQKPVQSSMTASQTLQLRDVLNLFKARYHVDILFEDKLINDQTVLSSMVDPAASLEKNLDTILRPQGLRYKKVKSGVYMVIGEKKPGKSPTADVRSETPMLNAQTSTTPQLVDNRSATTLSAEKAVAPVVVERTISGIVKSETGEGLPGVSVVVKNTTRGATTDAEGKYRLNIPDGAATLVFSFVGYQNQEISIGSRSTIDVQMIPDDKSLDEVVVVGYGTVKKSDLTGSLAQVKAKDLNAYPATNVLQALSGRAAGVQVLQNTGAPGGSVSVRIRGTNSIQGSNEPLYVVDGFPLSGSNPTVLNNADIENIEILKDASATAIYGSRGANGVVLITTKRGKAGKATVDFEASYSSQTLRKKLDMMNAKEYATFYNEQAANDGLKPYFTQDQINAFGQGTDWQNLVFQTAPMKTASLNISGGNEKTQFSLSGSVFSQDGIIRGSDYNRYSIRTNINHALSKKLSVNFASTLTKITTNAQNSQGSNRGGSLIAGAISAPPVLGPYKADGSYEVFGTTYAFVNTQLRNPINILNEQSSLTKGNRVLTNAAFIYNPIPELTIKISGGIENSDDRTDSYTTTNYFGSTGNASVSTTQLTSLLNENTISYNKTIRQKHSISAVAGFTYQDFLTTTLSGSGANYISNSSQTSDLGAAGTPGIPASGYSKSVLLSYLGRVNYAFDSKYLATVSFRADGSSKYSEGSKWGYFPSGALAWRISNEEFLKNSTLVSDLKLRASWGLTGSQAINAYATLNQLYSGKTIFGDALYTAYSPGTNLPGNLKWETTEQKDIGIDLGILQNRILITADYYIKNTRDLLNTVQLPSSLGFTTTIQNVGEVQNKGLELGINANILTGAFKWNVNTNVALNRNKVLKLYGGQDILGAFVDISAITDTRNILREGQPMGMFWGYIEDGYDDKGKIKYKDMDGDGTITVRDKTFIGNPNPKFIYGFNSSMSYKNFDLTLFLQGTQGNDIFNTSAINNTVDYGYGLNMPREVFLNHWTPTNTTAKYPLVSSTTRVNVSNRFVENGSYLRLKNIQLAYNLPTLKWGATWIRSMQVYASGQNLLTFTNYSWWDPEVNSSGGSNSIAQGFDQYSYPTAKSITFGVRAGF
ncbi:MULTISPECIES: TonB-dependent receptor [unclassified Spirosoma]|uniref:SusC/RagA family TonB-linked outer membrane protein n=1 Tax=unclassified Spirosoma TaxID=2621999 RepID=UPI000B1B6B26|nr:MULTISPECIES: TonB-dependent receptor [unclassified Spirosoma]